MLALEVELLTGRYVATSYSDRSSAEWPPHPARLFSALVATALEHEDLTPSTKTALEWLERQGPPEIEASDANTRAVVATFVPENATRVLDGWSTAEAKLEEARSTRAAARDSGHQKTIEKAEKAVLIAEKRLSEQIARAIADDGRGNEKDATELLPDRRAKQPRMTPCMVPHCPRIRYLWPASNPDLAIKIALTELGRRLVRLGHSSSFVTCRVLDQPDAPLSEARRWRPAANGLKAIRTIDEGQLGRLQTAFERHRGIDPRVLPAVHQGYTVEGEREQPEPTRSVFGDWITLREIASENGRRIGLKLQRTEDLTRALRGAVLSHTDEPIPELLSGHDANGDPLDRPHLAFIPLADVGSRYSTGNVLGLAILLPHSIRSEDRHIALRAIGRWEESGMQLTLGRVGVMKLERIVDGDPRRTLDPSWWTRPARRWASVTPVALDRNPGNLLSRDPREVAAAARRAEQIVAQSCERIGLPRPRWVEIVRRSLFEAAPAAREYAPFPRKRGSTLVPRRVRVHIEMCFEEPVAGPVLIGAGRYFGMGLCRGRE